MRNKVPMVEAAGMHGICLLVLMLMVVAVHAQPATYVAPDLEKSGIIPGRLTWDASTRAASAGQIVEWLKGRTPVTQPEFDHCSKAIALALLLNRTNRIAVIANVRLQRGDPIGGTPSGKTDADLAKYLLSQALELLKPISREDPRLAGLFLQFAAELAPDNEDILYQLEVYNQLNIDIDWGPIMGQMPLAAMVTASQAPVDGLGASPAVHPEYQDRSKAFGRHQSSIKGLFVQKTMSGLRAGMTLDVIASVGRTADTGVFSTRFAQPAGESMITSYQEAMRAIKFRYPFWEGGTEVSFSFSDKYSEKDGGSAGLAFFLLAWSLLEGVDLDPELAVTGDITVDWQVRRISGVSEKIRGATLDRCRYVLLPEANRSQVVDSVLIHSPDVLWKIQIISAANVAEAAGVARMDRSDVLQSAMDEFDNLQKLLNARGIAGLGEPSVKQALDKILARMPNHLSAQLLLEGMAGRFPNRLTVSGSIDEIFMTVAPVLPIFIVPPQHHTRFVMDLTPEVFQTGRERLKKIQPLVGPESVGLHGVATQFITALENMQTTANTIRRSGGRSVLMENRLASEIRAKDEALQALNAAIQEIQINRDIFEALIRQ